MQTLLMEQDDLAQNLREEHDAEVETFQKGQDAVDVALLELREQCATPHN